MKTLAFFFIAFLLVGCSKEDGPESSIPSNLKGTLFFDWADEGTLSIDATTGVKATFLPINSKRNGWDISRDKEWILTASKTSIWNDDITFVISKMSNGEIVNQFDYTPLNGGSGFHSGILSPDKTLIAIAPTFEAGWVLLKTDGSLLGHIDAINGEKPARGSAIIWLPGNSLLLTHKSSIIRLDPPYSSGKLIKEMNYEDWGDLTVNASGTKIALAANKHIYMMDIDGNNFVQVTESNDREVLPEFSPDGNYLLVGTDYTPSGTFSAIWRLKIIPADGNTYNVDPIHQNSPGVIPVIANGDETIQAASNRGMLWR
ncbi:TolB family protein [Sphingobacterium hungaricum]|uniref:WD40-like Beta Propeller Repeat n=1 Tax=Sphingobacterium hungaricum TaxID=2082723 RepID=A0A928UWT0_9SPHI|nr:hypothetical protein [Sphingobacterium hungaricum]MBE8712202.1 hypothetical protein [Sphingobacterium hungaricum]